jgi:hypothetical protein
LEEFENAVATSFGQIVGSADVRSSEVGSSRCCLCHIRPTTNVLDFNLELDFDFRSRVWYVQFVLGDDDAEDEDKEMEEEDNEPAGPWSHDMRRHLLHQPHSLSYHGSAALS